jgi:predicted transcriptional regulator
MAVRTNLLLPDDLVAEVDRIAGPRNRSRYVAEAVAARVRRDRLKEVWDRSFGMLKAEDHPEWATSEMVVEWIRALRAEETDPGPDPIPVVGTVADDHPPLRMFRRRVAETGAEYGHSHPDAGSEADRAGPR